MEKRFADRLKTFLAAGSTSSRGKHFIISQHLQDELVEDVEVLLKEAATIGAQHAQAMLQRQERAILLSGTKNFLVRAKEIVNGIIEHIQETIAKALGKNQEEQEPLQQSDVIDATMDDLIDALPDLVAGDEVTTSVEGTVYDTLLQAGVEQIQSVSEGDDKVCQICLDNEAAGAIPIGSNFPSGQKHSPFHNRCRCNIVAVEEL